VLAITSACVESDDPVSTATDREDATFRVTS
jgi:hypothetical protein